MDILEGLLTINGVDVYTEFNVFLAEDSLGSHTNYNELLKVPAMKAYTTVTFREENGERLPDTLPEPHYEARDVTLQFGLLADTKEGWYRKFIAFQTFLKSSWLVFSLPELGTTYKMYFKSCTTQQMITPFKVDGKIYGKMKMKFREPNPYITIDPSMIIKYYSNGA